MPTLTVTKNYDDGQILTEEMLDDAFDSIETFINTTKLGSDNIQDEAIETVNIAADAVTTVKIEDMAVTTQKINDSAVTTAKIADSNVTTAKIADSNVTTAKIANSNITTAKIADGAVTPEKRSALSYSSVDTATTKLTGNAYNNMGSVTITRTGRPVLLLFTPKAIDTRLEVGQDGVGYGHYLFIKIDSSASGTLFNDALFGHGNEDSDESWFSNQPNFVRFAPGFVFLDTTADTGSVTYTLYAGTNTSEDYGYCGVKFSAIEL